MGWSLAHGSMRCLVDPNLYNLELHHPHANITTTAITTSDRHNRFGSPSTDYIAHRHSYSNGEDTSIAVTIADERVPRSNATVDDLASAHWNTYSLTPQRGVSEAISREYEESQFASQSSDPDGYHACEGSSSGHAYNNCMQHHFQSLRTQTQSNFYLQDPGGLAHRAAQPASVAQYRKTLSNPIYSATSSRDPSVMSTRAGLCVPHSLSCSTPPHMLQGALSPVFSGVSGVSGVSAFSDTIFSENRRNRLPNGMPTPSQDSHTSAFDPVRLDMHPDGYSSASGMSIRKGAIPSRGNDFSRAIMSASMSFVSPVLSPNSSSGRSSIDDSAFRHLSMSPASPNAPSMAVDVGSPVSTSLGSPSLSGRPSDFISDPRSERYGDALALPEVWFGRGSSSPVVAGLGLAAHCYPSSVSTPPRIDGQPEATMRAPSINRKKHACDKRRKPRGRDSKDWQKSAFECGECPATFTLKKDRNRHVEIHLGKKYPCPICNKLSARKDGLRRHMRNLHQVVP